MSSIGIGRMSKIPDCPCLGGTLDKLIQPAILAALSHGPLHGYKLAERMSEMTGCCAGKPDLSGVYRFLKAMEARRLVVSSWDTPEKGHARRLFQITAEGEACLVKWSETLEAYHATIKGLLRQVRAAATRKARGKPSSTKVTRKTT
jgi:PadR family transcriptional regulator, regulatory protein PadR